VRSRAGHVGGDPSGRRVILQDTLAVRPAGGVVILSPRGSVALRVILGGSGQTFEGRPRC